MKLIASLSVVFLPLCFVSCTTNSSSQGSPNVAAYSQIDPGVRHGMTVGEFRKQMSHFEQYITFDGPDQYVVLFRNGGTQEEYMRARFREGRLVGANYGKYLRG